MKVAILGYKGFVGSAFYEFFSSDHAFEVIGISKDNYHTYLGNHFDLLINANGNSSKLLSRNDPKKDFEMNALSTLASIQDFHSKSYVYLSSGEVYNVKDNPLTSKEDSIIVPERLSNYGLSKYVSELLVKKYSKQWLILRLGGMLGKNMRKGPVFDILNLKKLFLSKNSSLQFLNTSEVVAITKKLIENGKWNSTYNVVANGNMKLSKIAELAGITITSEGTEEIILNISCDKINKELGVSSTADSIKAFLSSRY